MALPAHRDAAGFITWRQQRDATLSAPKLPFQSVQINIDGGHLPQPADNQIRSLRSPNNAIKPEPDLESLVTSEI